MPRTMSAKVSGERKLSVFAIWSATATEESWPATRTPKFVAEPAEALVPAPVPLYGKLLLVHTHARTHAHTDPIVDRGGRCDGGVELRA